MKIPEASNIPKNIVRFEELCASFSELNQNLMFQESYPVAVNGITLANEEISKLRAQLDIPQYSCPGIQGNLVANDYFAIGQIVEASGVDAANGKADEKGRIFNLTLRSIARRYDQVALLTELETIRINELGLADPSPLVNCLKLTSLRIGEIGDKKKLESVLKMMPWLKSVALYGYSRPSMNLDWARENRALESLYAPGLGLAELSHLTSCVNLKMLQVPFNPISSLAPIAKLSQLAMLDIRRTDLSELWSLCELPNLRWLTIDRSMPNLPGYGECKDAIERRGGDIKIQS